MNRKVAKSTEISHTFLFPGSSQSLITQCNSGETSGNPAGGLPQHLGGASRAPPHTLAHVPLSPRNGHAHTGWANLRGPRSDCSDPADSVLVLGSHPRATWHSGVTPPDPFRAVTASGSLVFHELGMCVVICMDTCTKLGTYVSVTCVSTCVC